MEHLFEEYGGFMIAVIAEIIMAGIIIALIQDGGALHNYIIWAGNAAC